MTGLGTQVVLRNKRVALTVEMNHPGKQRDPKGQLEDSQNMKNMIKFMRRKRAVNHPTELV